MFSTIILLKSDYFSPYGWDTSNQRPHRVFLYRVLRPITSFRIVHTKRARKPTYRQIIEPTDRELLEFDLPELSQEIVNLAYEIDNFVKIKHQFALGIDKEILKRVKFIVENYTQEIGEGPTSHSQRVRARSQTPNLQFPTDWAIDRASLRAAIREFDLLTEGLQLKLSNMADENATLAIPPNIQQMINAAV